MIARPLCWLALAAAAGCGYAADIGQPDEVTRLRVLAVRIEPPEAAPGATARADALVAAPADLPPAELRWALCQDHTGARLGADDCAGAAAGDLTALAGPDVELPEEPGELAIRLDVAAGDQRETAIATVLATLAPDPNRNPDLIEVAAEVDGDAIRLRADAEPPESFTGPDGGDRTEDLSISWYAVGASVDPPIASPGGEVALDLAGRQDEPVTVHAVLSDGRGGFDFRSLAVDPDD